MKKHHTQPVKSFSGELQVAPDKSMSHRALIFSALAEGVSKIRNLLLGEDVLCTLQILNQLGVKTSHHAQNIKLGDELIVHGVGLQGLKKSKDMLYCGNSGTTMRLMLGLLSGQNFESVLTGDDSLNKRPMERVLAPLRQMGAVFEEKKTGTKRFIHINPRSEKVSLAGIDYRSPVASAQVKTALILAGLNASGVTIITEPSLSRDHSEIMLKAMKAPLSMAGASIKVTTPKTLSAIDLDIPGDMSSAAFFIAATLIAKSSRLKICDVGVNPTRTGFLDVVQKMGGDVALSNRKTVCGEQVADIEVKSSCLKNVAVGGSEIPLLIDEIPILSLLAAVAEGEMHVKNAEELRVKETDRIRAICSELAKMGVVVQEQPGGFVVHGFGDARKLKLPASPFKSYGDHRMAMMECVAGMVLDGSVTIDDVACVNTSFPGFFNLLKGLT